MENRKIFLDQLALKLNIKKPSDWGKIPVKKVQEHGGNALLLTYYKGSLFHCLKSVYKGRNNNVLINTQESIGKLNGFQKYIIPIGRKRKITRIFLIKLLPA